MKALFAVALALSVAEPVFADTPARHFTFTYDTTLTGLPPGQATRVWLPVPSSDDHQAVRIDSHELPATQAPHFGIESKYHNRILYFEAPADARGRLHAAVTFHVDRRAWLTNADPPADLTPAPPTDLQADARVPLGGKPLTLLSQAPLPNDPVARARALYDTVLVNMTYRKDKPGWGNGDAVWACNSHFGNCTDFHSLFISLARSEHLPATFEIGFLLPEEAGRSNVAGYHCWAAFKPEGKAWVPVDISEASQHPEQRSFNFGNLTPNRVAFSTGRDLQLVPAQAGPPINFFIYPYAEAAGKPVPQSQIKKTFTAQDDPTPSH